MRFGIRHLGGSSLIPLLVIFSLGANVGARSGTTRHLE